MPAHGGVGLTGRAAVAQVGASVFAGVMMMIVLIPVNTKISKIQSGLNRQIMKLKDEVPHPAASRAAHGSPPRNPCPRRQHLPSTLTPPVQGSATLVARRNEAQNGRGARRRNPAPRNPSQSERRIREGLKARGARQLGRARSLAQARARRLAHAGTLRARARSLAHTSTWEALPRTFPRSRLHYPRHPSRRRRAEGASLGGAWRGGLGSARTRWTRCCRGSASSSTSPGRRASAPASPRPAPPLLPFSPPLTHSLARAGSRPAAAPAPPSTPQSVGRGLGGLHVESHPVRDA
jgi:hypothetical protein